MSHLYKFLVYNKINYSQHTILIVDFWTYCSSLQLGVCTLRLQVIPSLQCWEATLSLSLPPTSQAPALGSHTFSAPLPQSPALGSHTFFILCFYGFTF